MRGSDRLIGDDAAVLQSAVRDAGALALSLFRTDVRNWIKGESSPVSDADIAANDLLRARLTEASPDYGWLSEESADDEMRLGKERVWIVDPIDGTRSYLAGREDWCVSAALVSSGRPILAAVFAPVTQEFFVGILGGGATLNGRSLTASGGTGIDVSRLAGPKPLIERLMRGGPPDYGSPYPRIGSLALRLCRVAEGRIDAAFAGGAAKDWDLAAADLIVHEAGGRLTMLSGEALSYNSRDVTHGVLIAAGTARHDAIRRTFAAGGTR